MANTYDLFLTNGAPAFSVNESETVFDHGLTFTGRGVEEYGEHRNTNLLHLLENFANTVAPTNPLVGQFWYDKGAQALRVYNGTAFVPPVADDYVLGDGEGTRGTPAYTVGAPEFAANEVNLLRFLGGTVPVTNVGEHTDLLAHFASTTAHNATFISFDDTGLPITATNTEAAVLAADAYIDAHIADAIDAHDALAISYSNAVSGLTSTDVQNAILELDSQSTALDITIASLNTGVNNHINATVSAHDATAISYNNASSGLSAINVQDAIDEAASAGTTGGAGYIDYVRVSSTSPVAVSSGVAGGGLGPWVTIPFNNIEFGDNLNNFNTTTRRYVADRNMEVRARAYARFSTLSFNQAGNIRILKNNVNEIRTGFELKKASSNNPTDQTVEASCLTRLATGDYLEVQGAVRAVGGTITGSSIVAGRADTGFEIEVLKENVTVPGGGGAPPVGPSGSPSNPGSIFIIGQNFPFPNPPTPVATATIQYEPDGTLRLVTTGAPSLPSNQTVLDEWWTPIGGGGTNPGPFYEVRATLTSGSLNTGTINTWLPISTFRSWSVQRSGAGVQNANLSFQVRNAATLAVVISHTATISADIT